MKKSPLTRGLSYIKYGMLAVFVLAVPLWYGLARDLPLPAFCKYICPAGTLEGAVALLSHPANSGLYQMLGALFTWKFTLLLIILLACIFCYRSFCRFLCPLGALYGMFSRFSVVGVRVDMDRCTRCGACVQSCGMDVRRVGDAECIQCAQCMESCDHGAISLMAGGRTLKAPEGHQSEQDRNWRRKAGRFAWGIALVLLCFALLWFNCLDPSLPL